MNLARWERLKELSWFAEEKAEVVAFVEVLLDEREANRRELEVLRGLKRSVEEALNSGNGTYKP